VYYYGVETGENAGGTLTVNDAPSDDLAMRRVFGPDTYERTQGTIASDTEEYKVSVALTGECNLDLRIAGGIEYIWTV
jgi:hypothetical protein